ncbi:hypothetical protein DL764_000409 [Monosporascus ibericus]|uniref:Uncharacterized protein n=1 Tax=Monosporascus ibericus TaxID=155417 RepID=A0A4Q4TX47_9PEZI|nr:hypothetical protein DL764_000409 [Monosporascus ibericus]
MQPGIITAKEKAVSYEDKVEMSRKHGSGIPELGERDTTAVFDEGIPFLCITQPTETFKFAFFRLNKGFSWPKRNRYLHTHMMLKPQPPIRRLSCVWVAGLRRIVEEARPCIGAWSRGRRLDNWFYDSKGPKIAYGSDTAERFGPGGRLRWADEEEKEGVGNSNRLQWIISVVTVLMVAMGVTQLGWLRSLLDI